MQKEYRNGTETTQQSHRKEGRKMSIDRIQHVKKFNPYHGKDGRFTSKNGGGAGSAGGSGGKDAKQYTLKPKNGKGATWYMSADQINSKDYVKVTDKDGFETTVDIRNYDVFKNYDTVQNKEQNVDHIEHVEKFNPYHGKDGRFASANGAASFTYSPGKSKAHDNAIAREKERQAATAGAGGGAGDGEKSETKPNQEQIDRVKRFEEDLIHELQNDIKPEYRNEFNTVHALLNDATMENDIQRVKTSVENNDKEEMKRLRAEFKSTAADYASPWFDEDLGYTREGSKWESDFYNKLADLCKSEQHMAKNYDTIEHVEKNIDHIEEVQKYNHYHGKDGRFTSKNGAGAGAASGGGAGTKASEMDYNKIDDNKEYQVSGWSKDGKTITTTGVGVKQIIDLAGLQGNGDKVTIKEKGSGTLDNLKGVANKDVPGKKVKTVNGGGTVTMGERAAYDSFRADKIKIGTEYAISNIARGTVRVGTYNGPKHSSTGGSYSFTGRDGKKFGVDYDNTHMNPIYNVK